jgi:hypothetical protein
LQLFVLLFGLPYFMMAVGMAGDDLKQMFTILPIATLVFSGPLIAWLWSLDIHTKRWVSPDIRPNVRWFRLSLCYGSVYLLFLITLLMPLFAGKVGIGLFALIIPFHILAMICLLYAAYFVAKNFVMAERNVKVGFYECAGPFHLIWMYPIGIWLLQPRITRMFEEREGTQQDESLESSEGASSDKL